MSTLRRRADCTAVRAFEKPRECRCRTADAPGFGAAIGISVHALDPRQAVTENGAGMIENDAWACRRRRNTRRSLPE
jgi:hypothetical protein